MENKQCKECNLYNSLGCPYAGYDWKEVKDCDEFRPLEHDKEDESFCETSHRKTLWHKVADLDLPIKTGRYLVKYSNGTVSILTYCVEDNLGPYDEAYDFDADNNMLNLKRGFNDFDKDSFEYHIVSNVVEWTEIPE